MRNKKSSLMLLLSFIVLFGITASSQWPSCGWNCTAQDIVVDDVWLSDAGRTPVGQIFCTPGETTTAYQWARVLNNSNALR